MAYTKPQIIAQNASTGSYAAGCPAVSTNPTGSTGAWKCKSCERTQ